MILWLTRHQPITIYDIFTEEPEPHFLDDGNIWFGMKEHNTKTHLWSGYHLEKLFPKLNINKQGMKKIEITEMNDGYFIRELKL